MSNSAIHNFALRIPYDLWQRLKKHCEYGKISAFVIQAIKEKLDKNRVPNMGSP